MQYACPTYVDTSSQHGIIESMSRPGNPYDNAECERFMWTLKQKEIRCREYRELEDLRANLQVFFERFHDAERLHSALGYRSPEPSGRQYYIHFLIKLAERFDGATRSGGLFGTLGPAIQPFSLTVRERHLTSWLKKEALH